MLPTQFALAQHRSVTWRMLIVFTVIAGSFWLFPSSAIHAQTTAGQDACTAFRLLTQDKLPTITSGKALTSGTAQDGIIDGKTAGSRWTFRGKKGDSLKIILNASPADLSLTAALLYRQKVVQQSDGQSSLTALLPEDGFYTLLIKRAEAANPSQNGSYQLTVEYPNLQPITKDQIRTELVQNQKTVPEQRTFDSNLKDVVLDNGVQDLVLSNNIHIVTNVGAVEDVEIGALTNVMLYGGAKITVASISVTRIEITEGNLQVTTSSKTTPVNLYVRGVEWITLDLGDMRSPSSAGKSGGKGDDNPIVIGNALKFKSDASLTRIKSIWVSKNCNAIDYGQGHILTTNALDIKTISSTAPNALDLTFAGYTVTTDFSRIDEISMLRDVLEVKLDKGTHNLVSDRPRLITEQNGDKLTFDGNRVIQANWNLVRYIEIRKGQVALQVNDDHPIIRRTWEPLANIVIGQENDTIVLKKAGTDAGQSVLYPDAESFIEIETPAGTPPKDIGVLAGQPGYVPGGSNLVGADCWFGPFLDCPANDAANPANGNLYYAVTDLIAPNVLRDFTLTRHYNSRMATLDGPFGRGWSTDYALDYRIAYSKDLSTRPVSAAELSAYLTGLDLRWFPYGVVTLSTGSGTQHVFRDTGGRQAPTNVYLSTTERRWQLTKTATGWVLQQDNRIEQVYDRAGRWRETRFNGQPLWYGEVHANSQTLRISGATLTSAFGQKLDAQYDEQGHIIHIDQKAANGRVIQSVDYGYDDAGFLTSANYPDGTSARYSYNKSGMLESRTDPHAPSMRDARYEYTGDGRLNTIKVPISADKAINYRTYRYAADKAGTTVTITDVNNVVQTLTYDTGYFLIASTAGGTSLTYKYEAGLLQNIVNDQKASILIQYDAQHSPKGALVGQVSFPFGTSVKTDYNDQGLLEVYTTASSTTKQISKWQYNDGRVQQYQASEKGPVTSYTYNSAGLLQEVKGTNDLHFDYTDGMVTAVNGAISWRLKRDDRGRITEWQVDPQHRLVYQYFDSAPGQPFARKITVIDYVGAEHTYLYNERGLVTEIRVISMQKRIQLTRYQYDPFDRPILIQQFVDDKTTLDTHFSYETVMEGGYAVLITDPYKRKTVRRYGPDGNLIQADDGRGTVLDYVYATEGVNHTVKVNNNTGLAEGFLHTYNPMGNLEKITGPLGTTWNLAYRPDGTVARMISPNGPTIEWENHPSGLPKAVTISYPVNTPQNSPTPQKTPSAPTPAPANTLAKRVIQYEYDNQDNLAAVTDPSGKTTFTLEQKAGVTQLTVTRGDLTHVLTFDALGRLIKLIGADKSITTLSYTEDPANGQTHVTLGKAGADGRVQARWTYDLNVAGQMVQWIGPDQVVHKFQYDQLGHLLESQTGGLPEGKFSYTYNHANLLENMVDGLGREWRYTYDAAGRLQIERDPLGNVTSYTYNALGNLASITSPTGSTTTIKYDALGRPVSLTNPLGVVERFVWDTNRLKFIDGNGDANAVTYKFDPLGVLQTAQNAAGTLGAEFDTVGNLISLTDNKNITRYTYGRPGLPERIDGLEQAVWQFTYNAANQLETRTDPTGHVIGFGYDVQGQLNNVQADKNLLLKIERQWDVKTITVTDNANQQRVLAVDGLGRLTTITVPATATPLLQIVYNMDENGGIGVTKGSSPAAVYRWDRDPKGRPALKRSVPNQESLYVFDPNGDVVEVQNIFQVAFETGDEKAPAPKEPKVSTWKLATKISYDGMGMPIIYTDSIGRSQTFTYDPAGNLIVTRTLSGEVYQYKYDKANRLIELIGSAGKPINYTYDSQGNLETIGIGSKLLARFTYDGQNRLHSEEYGAIGQPDAFVTAYEYDPAGNLIRINNPNKDQITYSYAADAPWSLQEVKFPTSGSTTYTSNGAGRLAAAKNVPAELTFLPKQFQVGKQAIEAGPTYLKGFNNLDTTYEFDNLGRPLSAINNGTKVSFDYQYLPDNKIDRQNVALHQLLDAIQVTLHRPNGVSTEMHFNAAGQTTYVRHFKESTLKEPITTYEYQYDVNGRLVQAVIAGTKLDDARVVVYGYDANGRIVSERQIDEQTGKVLFALTTSYDDQGRRIGEQRTYGEGQPVQQQVDFEYYDNGLLKSRSVRALNRTEPAQAAVPTALALAGIGVVIAFRKRQRWLLAALIGVMLLIALPAQASASTDYQYAYDAAGNLREIKQNGQPWHSYTYDERNRLKTVWDSKSPLADYSYDGLGRLACRTTNGSKDCEQRYFYDGTRLIAIVAGQNGTVYVQTPQGQMLFWQDDKGLHWPLDDGRGANLQVLDEGASEPSVSAHMSATGELLSDTGIFPLSFDGMLWDPQAKLYLHEGRAYDPETGMYLQLAPDGPDSLGNLIVYSPLNTHLPVNREPHTLLTGLQRLTQLQMWQQHVASFDASSVLQAAMPDLPDPTPLLPSGLNQMAERLRSDETKMAQLAVWLRYQSNHQDVMFDHQTRQLQLQSAGFLSQNSAAYRAAMTSLDMPEVALRPYLFAAVSIPLPSAIEQRVQGMMLESRGTFWFKTPTAVRYEVIPANPAVPDQFLSFAPQPLVSSHQAAGVITAARGLPTDPLMEWLPVIERRVLPQPPNLPEGGGADLLKGRLTWDTWPLFAQKRRINALPNAPTFIQPQP